MILTETQRSLKLSLSDIVRKNIELGLAQELLIVADAETTAYQQSLQSPRTVQNSNDFNFSVNHDLLVNLIVPETGTASGKSEIFSGASSIYRAHNNETTLRLDEMSLQDDSNFQFS